MKRLELEGKKIGLLTVLRLAYIKNKATFWLCKCDCGVETTVIGSNLSSRYPTKSCGCLILERAKKHNKSKTSTYGIWSSMKSRCNNPNNVAYKNYGGRGIKVCRRWNLCFENFLLDMGEVPSKDHSIERENNSKGYTPKNCKWATRKEQANNNRCNVILKFNGEALTISQWADKLNLSKGMIHARYSYNWSTERILTEPIHLRKRRRT